MIIFGICDDNIDFIDNLEININNILSAMPDYIDYQIRKYHSAEDAIKRITSDPVSILLLDIDMPEIDGFHVAEEIQKFHNDIIIIFVSAYEEFVFKSFQFHPIGFLRKNWMDKDLKQTITNAINRFFENNAFIMFKTIDGEKSIRLKDICFIECQKNYYIIHLNSCHTYKCRGTLSSIENKLTKNGFFRIQKGIIVNMQYIDSLKPGYKIVMKPICNRDKVTLQLSMKKSSSFKSAYMEFIRKQVFLN